MSFENVDDGVAKDEGAGGGDAEKPTARMLSWSKNSAAYRLARRMMSERELADAIKRKAKSKFEGITDVQLRALAEHAIAFGRNMKALDDENYAQVRSGSAARSGKSPRAVARKLAEKGIERGIIEMAVGEIDEVRAAVVYARKKGFGPFRRPDVKADDGRWSKEIASFARQGFGFDLAKRILDMDRDEAEDILLRAV
ncbi:regulatory protein RecX [Rhizobium wuzhouense]|uniref:Regulatory protein RecX n=1 Tax=Rhizobium wuzhouense TaxID=1986026 RepID=A0ABX5NRB8_9HYPH|nr:regulatory protein RecX [Rhizobium wuzhouense]PYB71972.1 recombination regulator RecX [Rhizobium wuzhouense]